MKRETQFKNFNKALDSGQHFNLEAKQFSLALCLVILASQFFFISWVPPDLSLKEYALGRIKRKKNFFRQYAFKKSSKAHLCCGFPQSQI